MFVKNNFNGAQLFSTGKQILVNWRDYGLIIKNPMIVGITTEISAPTSITILGEDNVQFEKHIPNSKITLEISSTEINHTNDTFNFEELVKEDLKMEDILKIAHSQIVEREQTR